MKSAIGVANNSRKVEMITGASLLLMAVLAMTSMGAMFNGLFSLHDGELSAFLHRHEVGFRLGILAWIGILILDVLVAWGFYVIYKGKNDQLSLLTGWFRLIYAAILGVAVAFLVLMLPVLEMNSTDSLALGFLLEGFQGTWSFGLIIFGLHLLGLGSLVIGTKILEKILGVLVLIAGVGYVFTNVLAIGWEGYEDFKASIEMVFMLPMILGEVGLGLYMLVWGNKA